MREKGYTLMELIVVIGVMVIILGAGMGSFYQSLRSGSKIDFEAFLDSSSRVIESSMISTIAFSRVVSVDGQDQESCLNAGSSGVTGDSLTIDVGGETSTYLLGDSNISSNSAQINPDGVVISSLAFDWVCITGEIERLTVSFNAQVERDGQTVAIERDYEFEVLIKNSGYY